MQFLKATISSNDFHDGETEFFNLSQILTIKPYSKKGTSKILMGAGLYYSVYTDSIELVTLTNENIKTTLNQ